MANKPIKQYATLTDEAGVEAMTVATGGAVTVGPSGGLLTKTHQINGLMSAKNSVTALLGNGGEENILTAAPATAWLCVARGDVNTGQSVYIVNINGAGAVSAAALVAGSTPFSSGGTSIIKVTNNGGASQYVYYSLTRLL